MVRDNQGTPCYQYEDDDTMYSSNPSATGWMQYKIDFYPDITDLK